MRRRDRTLQDKSPILGCFSILASSEDLGNNIEKRD
jgi:hypothetical protein